MKRSFVVFKISYKKYHVAFGVNTNLPYLQWKDVDPNQIMDYKLKCVFENPVSSAAPASAPTVTSTSRSDANVTDGKKASDAAKSSSKVKQHSL